MTADPFGTAGHRERVLAMWTSAPVRFREDANAEEELALGGYRDRVVVELAQNAADAAVRAGVPGRLLLRLEEIDGRAVLVAANTGAPLDAAGVLALATLRASAKRDRAAAGFSGPPGAPDTTAREGTDAASLGGQSTVGRFGVGFSAVLGVTDEPVIVSRHGGVRFSAADTRDVLAEAARLTPGLADELARRDGHVPALRLPFPAEGAPPPGYDTAVLLPLRDAAAEDLVLRLLDEVGDPLLLALPGLSEVTVTVPGRPPRTVADVEDRWHVLRRGGLLDPADLADRPTEERARRTWSVAWAIPREGAAPPDPLLGGPGLAGPGLAGALGQGIPAVVYAPTPSDEPLPWQALLVATFPLDSSRRHVAPGPATDAVVRHAAAAYAELLSERAAAGASVWRLVPVGLPAGALDAALRTEVLHLLPRTPLLPDAAASPDRSGEAPEDPLLLDPLLLDPHPLDPPAPQPPASRPPAPRLLAPRDAVALEPPAGADPGVVAVLAPWLSGLVVAPRGVTAVLAALGIRTVPLADAVEQLPAVADPAAWRRMYAALSGLTDDPLAREGLAALPVPVADGRVVRGVRGLLLPAGPPEVAQALGALGLRAVHADAAHPLLERLGAVAVDARAALELTGVRELVAASADGDVEGDPEALADAVLTLVTAAVRAGTLEPGELPYLADLWLTDDEGDAVPAGALLLPGSTAEQILDPDEVTPVDDALLQRWGRPVLAAVGVLESLAVLHREDVPLDPDAGGAGDAGDAGLDGRGVDPDGLGLDPVADALLQRLPGEPTGGRQDPRDLDGWDDWVDAVLAALPADPVEATVLDLLAVHDLELIRDRSWPQALALLAADPRLRPAVTTPARVRVQAPDGSGPATDGMPDRRAWRGRARTSVVDVPSYTAWWLARELAGDRAWADPDAEPGLAAVLPAAPPLLAALDPGMRRALGAVASAADLDVRAVQALVDALADPDTDLAPATVLRVWSALAELAGSVGGEVDVEPPDLVRVLDGPGTRVVAADRAVVVDEPVLLQRVDLGLPVLAAGPEAGAALARLLDLPLAADLVEGVVDEVGEPGMPTPVPQAARTLVPQAPATWCEHDRLLVDGVEVEWWVEPADDERPAQVHACTVEGLAYALAWAGSAWHRRAGVAEVLADPGRLPRLVAEEAFVPWGRIGESPTEGPR